MSGRGGRAWCLLRLGLHRLPPREFPRIRGVATELATYDGARELDEGLVIVLAGLHRVRQGGTGRGG